MMEMDGTGPSTGPVDTTPFRERLDAARAIPKSNGLSTQDMDEQQRMEKTAALKNLLRVQSTQMGNNGAPPPQTNAMYGQNGGGREDRQPHFPPSYGQPHASPMASNGIRQAGAPPNVQAMEADLRRILKLGPS